MFNKNYVFRNNILMKIGPESSFLMKKAFGVDVSGVMCSIPYSPQRLTSFTGQVKFRVAVFLVLSGTTVNSIRFTFKIERILKPLYSI